MLIQAFRNYYKKTKYDPITDTPIMSLMVFT